MHWECKYCDGVSPVYWHSDKTEPMVCMSCGAEWESAKILVEEEIDYENYSYDDCEYGNDNDED